MTGDAFRRQFCAYLEQNKGLYPYGVPKRLLREESMESAPQQTRTEKLALAVFFQASSHQGDEDRQFLERFIEQGLRLSLDQVVLCSCPEALDRRSDFVSHLPVFSIVFDAPPWSLAREILGGLFASSARGQSDPEGAPEGGADSDVDERVFSPNQLMREKGFAIFTALPLQVLRTQREEKKVFWAALEQCLQSANFWREEECRSPLT